MAYDAELIDRTADPTQTNVRLFLHGGVEVNPGDLFVVNEGNRCEGPYVVLGLEQIGTDAIGVGPAETPAGTGTTEEAGPGFGVPTAVAVLGGIGWLLGRGRRNE